MAEAQQFPSRGNFDEGYIITGLYEDGTLGEVFIYASKQGSTVCGLMNTIAILISLALQHGVPLEDIVRMLKYMTFEPNGRTINPEIKEASSIPDYIARYLESKFLGAENTDEN